MTEDLQKNFLDEQPGVGRAVPFGPAHPLAAFLLEYTNFRPPRLPLDDREDPRVGHEGGPGEHFAALFFDEQDLAERDLRAGFARSAVDESDGARRHLDLAAVGLNDCVHTSHLWKVDSVHPKLLRCKGLG